MLYKIIFFEFNIRNIESKIGSLSISAVININGQERYY